MGLPVGKVTDAATCGHCCATSRARSRTRWRNCCACSPSRQLSGLSPETPSSPDAR
jgi:hypothetical protein